jgi:hypothetical protein
MYKVILNSSLAIMMDFGLMMLFVMEMRRHYRHVPIDHGEHITVIVKIVA